MLYRDFKDKKLSFLGMGCMRLPGDGYGNSFIDVEETEKMVEYAISKGVNYFDTAWGYHAGESEKVIGKILNKYPRESYYIATKFPGYDLSNMDKVEEIFEEQLNKTGMEYFDFYMFHNVCEVNIDEYLNPAHGIFDYLLKQKKNGRIRHLGFSAHGDLNVMKRFLSAYGKDMEFCQIQLNWLDWSFQNAKEKTELLKEWKIPVWVMEPLRGGKLASLKDEFETKLKNLRPDEKIPAWSFRFLQGMDDIKMVLSGMSNFEQMADNIETFHEMKPLNEEEEKALFDIANEMLKVKTLPCTACNYCTTHCPMELDIPKMISLYNEHCFSGGGFIPTMAVSALAEDKRPDACIGCQSCEAVCPQQIKISQMMSDFVQRLK